MKKREKAVWRDRAFEQMADPVILLDTDLKILDANRAAVKLSGMSMEDMAEKHCGGIFTCEAIPFRWRQEDLIYLEAGDMFSNQEIHHVLDLAPLCRVLFEGVLNPQVLPLPRQKERLQEPELLLNPFHSDLS